MPQCQELTEAKADKRLTLAKFQLVLVEASKFLCFLVQCQEAFFTSAEITKLFDRESNFRHEVFCEK